MAIRMTRFHRSLPLVIAAVAIVPLASCSRGPARVGQPSISPSGAGSQAVEAYDQNSDGVISGNELDAVPALKAALPRFDTNGDKGVSSDEIAARVNAWKDMRTGLASVRCHITLDGQPLAGAEVVFEPEPFLGDEVKQATGTTNQFGDVAPTISKEDRPDPSLPGGVHFGLYKVRISKNSNGRETIPARYNKDTILGQEVAYDDPGIMNNNLAFNLKSGG
jgi:hypothetical protein